MISAPLFRGWRRRWNDVIDLREPGCNRASPKASDEKEHR